MLNGGGAHNKHDRFRELCALADTGNLTLLELSELQLHLQHCKECVEVLREYRALQREGMSALAANYAERCDQ